MKLECLRLLTTLRLDPDRMKLISEFIYTYLRLNRPKTTRNGGGAFGETADNAENADDLRILRDCPIRSTSSMTLANDDLDRRPVPIRDIRSPRFYFPSPWIRDGEEALRFAREADRARVAVHPDAKTVSLFDRDGGYRIIDIVLIAELHAA